MALILIRGENRQKLLNAVSDMEKHANLVLVTKPKVISAEFADSLVEQILKSKLRTSSKVATAFFVKGDTTSSILKIKEIHPPAHIVVVSREYKGYDELKEKLNIAQDIPEYHSNRAFNAGKIDYSLKGDKKFIENNVLNSYIE